MDLSDPGIQPTSLASPELAGRFSTTEPPGEEQRQLLIAPERMKWLGQSRNDAQFWMCLVVKVKSDVVKNNIT